MKKQINLICSILALLCFLSTFVPIVALRYPASDYYAPEGNTDYFFTGDYYLAKSYWSVTDYAFSRSPVWRVVLSVSQALLLLWAFLSVRGEAGKSGLAIAVLNLLVVGIVVIAMLSKMWSCRWGVLAVLATDCIAAVVMAALARK